MEAQQYNLRWNHFHMNLSAGFQSLFRDQDLVDVTLAVDGRYFKAHKMVLSVCSPYFKELFHMNPCKHPIVVLQDVKYKIFKNLLTFMYQGVVKVSQIDLPAFLKVAEVLKVKGLTELDSENNDSPTGDEQEKTTDNKPPEANLANSGTSTNGFPQIPSFKEQIAASARSIKPKISRPPPLMLCESSNAKAKRPRIDAISSLPMEEKPRETREQKPEIFVQQGQKPKNLQPHPQQPPQQQQRQKMSLLKPKHERLDKDKEKSQKDDKDKQKERSFERIMEMDVPPSIGVKEEPIDDYYQDDMMTNDNDNDNDSFGLDLSSIVSTSLGEGNAMIDTSTPGTLQCIIGKRGLPRLVVDGYTFYKKSTYKNKCFWYCKTNRCAKCPAVCWTINGCIVKWPEAHTHEMIPEVINPLEDSIVPIENLKQVLIDAARSSVGQPN